MRFCLAMVMVLTASSVWANEQAVVQSQLASRINEEMNKAISCEVAKSQTTETLAQQLKDADDTQDELQDAQE